MYRFDRTCDILDLVASYKRGEKKGRTGKIPIFELSRIHDAAFEEERIRCSSPENVTGDCEVHPQQYFATQMKRNAQ